jgi:hypothetical protein
MNGCQCWQPFLHGRFVADTFAPSVDILMKSHLFAGARSTVTLYRPVGPEELALIEESGWRAYPPRLPEQPIFYPVTNEEYAIQIARDWNVRASGAGYVTAFEIDADYVSRFPTRIVGNRIHEELWVPAEELPEFNTKIVGLIRVTRVFPE